MKKEMILCFIDFKLILCCLLTYLKFSAFKQMQNGCRAGKKNCLLKSKSFFIVRILSNLAIWWLCVWIDI